jgi:hypothetical protein
MVADKCIQVYKKKFTYKNKNSKKYVVFDLDETLGCFNDLSIIWNIINENSYIFTNDSIKTNQDKFNALLDIYPEFIRYGIINILEYLYYKMTSNVFEGLYLYTNNQIGKTWSKMIIHYLEDRSKTPNLFKHIIYAFKINKRKVEPNRKSHDKSYSDFINCSLLPKGTEICFIDNTYYEKLHHNKVYYICPKPYIHDLNSSEVIDRLFKSNLLKNANKQIFIDYYLSNNNLSYYTKSQNEINEDLYISKKILYYIQDFFVMTTKSRNTRKRKTINIGNFTRKKINH